MLRVAVGHAQDADACDGLDRAVAMLGETGAAATDVPMPGLLYLSQALAGQAGLALAHARELLPRVDWYGAVVPTVFGIDDELDPDSPALLVALLPVPPGQWRPTAATGRPRPSPSRRSVRNGCTSGRVSAYVVYAAPCATTDATTAGPSSHRLRYARVRRRTARSV